MRLLVGTLRRAQWPIEAVDAVFGALMINAELTTYYFKGKSNHEKCHSINAIAAHLESTRLEIFTAILDVTRQTGAIARDTLRVVKKQRFFEGTVWHFYSCIKFHRLRFSYVTHDLSFPRVSLKSMKGIKSYEGAKF